MLTGRISDAPAMAKPCMVSCAQVIPKEAAGWFKIFFQGLDNLFFPYTEQNFENPVSFRLDNFADDDSTQHLYSIMIRPCFLPVGMSTSNRIIKPGYECYQPVVVARQLGLGQVPPHFFLHHLTASRAELPDILTGQRALGPLLRQLDAEYDIPADQQQDGPAPTQADGSPFVFLPPAPVVLFCQSSPPLKKVIMQSQPISPKSAPKSKASSGPVAPRASTQARTAVRKVAVRKTLKRKAPAQESLQTNETSSGDVEEVPMPSAALGLSNSPSVTDQVANLAKTTAKPIVTTSASLPFLGEGCDPSSLLTFDPDSIEPAVSKAGEEPDPSAVDGPLQRLKVLLSSPVDTLVENPEAIKGILEDIQPHLP
ncbi:hypothetical protein QYE76_047206 [Lolium multiflorum]|uniref:Uncharacterized protein n=1 Tax=Lolium multiflorum TaxID=4521 RepID=A0AAD8X1R1_LOLMU|nr:hypothetical protein QYE76_047206 [Lolium multiflorum]